MKYYLAMLTGIVAVLLTVSYPMPLTMAAEQEMVYGWQLMTPEERTEYRAKMQSLKTEQEREAYRREHHALMQERAKEKGVALPDEPQPRGKGMGRGSGPGQGPGMGPGYGQGRGG